MRTGFAALEVDRMGFVVTAWVAFFSVVCIAGIEDLRELMAVVTVSRCREHKTNAF